MNKNGRRLQEVGRSFLGDPLPRNVKSHRVFHKKQEVAGGLYTYVWRVLKGHTCICIKYSGNPLLAPADSKTAILIGSIPVGCRSRRSGVRGHQPPAKPLLTPCQHLSLTRTTPAARPARVCTPVTN